MNLICQICSDVNYNQNWYYMNGYLDYYLYCVRCSELMSIEREKYLMEEEDLFMKNIIGLELGELYYCQNCDLFYESNLNCNCHEENFNPFIYGYDPVSVSEVHLLG